jgi:hypothetical protein
MSLKLGMGFRNDLLKSNGQLPTGYHSVPRNTFDNYPKSHY